MKYLVLYKLYAKLFKAHILKNYIVKKNIVTGARRSSPSVDFHLIRFADVCIYHEEIL